jgi:nucleotide-binding universal stress UspA family protein
MKTKPDDKAGGVVVGLTAKETQLPARESDDADTPSPVFRLKKIFVPMDFSNGSKKALQYAIPFARQFGAELILFHVIAPYVPVPGMEPTMGAIPMQEGATEEDAQDRLKELQWLVGVDVPFTTLTRIGNPFTEIIGMAKVFDVDLIIISTHGRTGLEHILLGSTAEKIVRHSNCPVLIVREHERDFIVPESMADGMSGKTHLH